MMFKYPYRTTMKVYYTRKKNAHCLNGRQRRFPWPYHIVPSSPGCPGRHRPSPPFNPQSSHKIVDKDSSVFVHLSFCLSQSLSTSPLSSSLPYLLRILRLLSTPESHKL